MVLGLHCDATFIRTEWKGLSALNASTNVSLTGESHFEIVEIAQDLILYEVLEVEPQLPKLTLIIALSRSFEIPTVHLQRHPGVHRRHL